MDAKGKELNDVSDDYIAKLDTDSVTGYTKLIAGKTEGIVYLKYVIDEDVYATAEKPKSYATNNSLHSTAMIAVNVSREAFNEGTITIAGELTGIAGDPAKAIEGKDGLTVEIRDPSMKKHSRPVVWDAQELPTDGITVKNNQISFTKEGTFHVRAKTGEVFSDWYEVTALPARKLTTITIPEMLTVDYKLEHTVNLAALQVSYKDQYGADWTPVPALTWSCADEGVSIDENGVLTIPSVGTYTVTAEGGGIASNTMTITVIDSTTKVTAFTPEARMLSSSGGSVEFTITGAYLPDTGILIQANDSIKAMTTGTATEQKATLTFPANDTENDQPYTVTNSLDSRTAAVTVAKKYSGGSSSGGGGGGSSKPTPKPETKPNPGTKPNDPTQTGIANWLRTDKHTTSMTGYGNGLFGPEDKVTRAQVAQIFYRLLKDNNVKITVNFTDVPDDAWYATAVNTLGSLGIVGGIGDGRFDPNRPITRAEFCVIATRFAKVVSTVENPFSDINAQDWYYTAVTTAASYDWVTGMGDGSFRPYDVITRAQAATIINRMLGAAADRAYVDEHVTNPYRDVAPTHWAYYQIMEASIAHDHSYDVEGVEIWTGLK